MLYAGCIRRQHVHDDHSEQGLAGESYVCHDVHVLRDHGQRRGRGHWQGSGPVDIEVHKHWQGVTQYLYDLQARVVEDAQT